MESTQHRPSEQIRITCSRCKSSATVPFQPTPGRPVFCRSCFVRTPQGRPPAPGKSNIQPRRRMLSQRRKGHFVHDALGALDEAAMDEQQRRTFVEMVFARGSRQDTQAAISFIDEKQADDTITGSEAVRLAQLVEDYSLRR